MPVYSVSFAFGTDHLAIFSSSLSGCYFFHSRVYQAQCGIIFYIGNASKCLAYLVNKHLKSHWEFCKLWPSTCPIPLGDKHNIRYRFWSTWSAIRLQYCYQKKLTTCIYLSYNFTLRTELERNYLAADENYSHTNMSFFYTQVSFY